MSKSLSITIFCLLSLISLASGGWVMWQGWQSKLILRILHNPSRASKIDATVTGRRDNGVDEPEITYQFHPIGSDGLPVTSVWVSIPRKAFLELPESEATIPVVYVAESPRWNALEVEIRSPSYIHNQLIVVSLLFDLGILIACLGIAWSYLLCFSSSSSVIVPVAVGCLSETGFAATQGTVKKLMKYRVWNNTYLLDKSHHLHEVRCAFCQKAIKLRIASLLEARAHSAYYLSGIVVAALMIGFLMQAFWRGCPDWVVPVLRVSGPLTGVYVLCYKWNRIAWYEACEMIEGRGEVVHSEAKDDGSKINWYEHMLMQ